MKLIGNPCPDIKNLSIGLRTSRHFQKAFHRIIDKEKVPQDPAVTEHRDLFIINGLPDEPVDNTVFIMGHLVAGTVGVRNAETGPRECDGHRDRPGPSFRPSDS